MEQFLSLFKDFIRFTYSCFDRIVLNGYIVNLIKESDIIYFFKQIVGKKLIDKETLSERTKDYVKWVEAYSKKNNIPFEWAVKGERKEEITKPYLEKMIREGNNGVYYIMKSMEIGTTYRSVVPKYTNGDPNYRRIQKHRSRFAHYYFYIYDEVLGNMSIRVGTYLPFNATYYLNEHNFIEQELKKNSINYKKKDNAFLSPDDNRKIQEADERFKPEIIRERLDYWSFVVCPKFSGKEREKMYLNRTYYISQIEYSVNFIFKRNLRIKELFQKACQTGIASISYDMISRIFGKRIYKRRKGKLQSKLEKFQESMHIFRVYFKNSFLKQYQKDECLLRNELVCNNLGDFGLKKPLDNLMIDKEHFVKILDNFAGFQEKLFNINFSTDIFIQLSKPVLSGKVKVPGIKIDNDRVIRLMEFLLRYASGCNIFSAKEIYQKLLKSYDITENDYKFNQLQYDIRKLKAHGIIEKINKTHNYKITDFGQRVCILLTAFRKNIYGPIQNQQFVFKPNYSAIKCDNKFDKIIKKINKDIETLCSRLAA